MPTIGLGFSVGWQIHLTHSSFTQQYPSGQVLVELLSQVIISSTSVGKDVGISVGSVIVGAGVTAGILMVGAGDWKTVGSPVSSGGNVTGDLVGALKSHPPDLSFTSISPSLLESAQVYRSP